jgi:hypothetical protein
MGILKTATLTGTNETEVNQYAVGFSSGFPYCTGMEILSL